VPDSEDKGFCDLSGRIALVTGASGGIGGAIALELGRAGATIAAHYNEHEERAQEVVEQIELLGGHASTFWCDLRHFDEIPGFVTGVVEKLGPPDILINNAGVNLEGFLIRINEGDVKELFAVNLLSTFYLSKECAKHMLKKHWGRIVFISSPAAVAGSPGQSIYASSKAGFTGFSKSLSLELGKRNITSNVVIPGIVETAMLKGLTDERRRQLLDRIPLERFAEPWEVAKFVRFVVSEEAAYLNGQELHINGGGVIF
jgi:3-oxoacyl-[acyl-carrier protein] reductase